MKNKFLNRDKFRVRWQILMMLCLLSVGSVSFAHHREKAEGSPAIDLNYLVQESDLIVVGSVKALEYKLSEANDAGERLPFTFVHISVRNSFKGKASNDITLRFMGGHAGNGLYMSVEGYPSFSVGDRSLFFIKNNTQAACPLVDCEHGRFRVFEGNVFGEFGREVIQFQEGRMLGYGANTLPVNQRTQELTTASPIPEETRREVLQFIQEKHPEFAQALRNQEALPQAQQEELLKALLERFPSLRELPLGSSFNANPNQASRITPRPETKDTEGKDEGGETASQQTIRSRQLSVEAFIQLIADLSSQDTQASFKNADIADTISLARLPELKAAQSAEPETSLNEEEQAIKKNNDNPVLGGPNND